MCFFANSYFLFPPPGIVTVAALLGADSRPEKSVATTTYEYVCPDCHDVSVHDVEVANPAATPFLRTRNPATVPFSVHVSWTCLAFDFSVADRPDGAGGGGGGTDTTVYETGACSE